MTQSNQGVSVSGSTLESILVGLATKINYMKQEIGIYIFGTGEGGKSTLNNIRKVNSNNTKYKVKGFLDNNHLTHGETIEGVIIYEPIAELIDFMDFVLIASFDHCYEMEEQLLDIGVGEDKIILPGSWLGEVLGEEQPVEVERQHTADESFAESCMQYVEDIFSNVEGNSKEFVELDSNIDIKLTDSDVKLIAFYLPQFHPIPENDKWWGRGFTEWTNVTKAVPQYIGHYQPHLPIDVGFYDLRNIEVMKRQTELARKYGIYGFCFHHYWFGGNRLLETPVDNFLGAPELDFPFCLCWANENWTRRWDGLENDVLIAQDHSDIDDMAFIKDISKYFKDSRYIRINGKILFIVYRPLLFPDIKATVTRWRDYCSKQNIGELFIVGVKAFGFSNPDASGLDALVEFPPNSFIMPTITNQVNIMNPNFNGQIYDYTYCVKKKHYYKKNNCITFKTVVPSWDNTARRSNNASIFHGACPQIYQEWLENTIKFTQRNLAIENQIVFINAWNEWAEGAHLEPDSKYGYGNLQATANAIFESRIGK